AARRRAMVSCEAISSLAMRSRSAALMVVSSSTRTSPILTACPSCTWMARTTPVSNGWISLVRPVGTILPEAVAMMATRPKVAQQITITKNRMMVAAIARPTGEAGVSTISIAAGRNSTCARRVADDDIGRVTTTPLRSADFMETCLEAMQRGIATVRPDQFVDDAAASDGDDAVGAADGGEPVGDDQDGAALPDASHVVLDDPLAFIVERARGLIEDQDARVGDECAGNRDALALAAGQARAPLAHHGVVALGELQNELVRAGKLRRGHDVFGRRPWIGKCNVVPNRPVEKHVFLQHHADLAAQPRDIDHRKIDAVDQHAPGFRHVEALNQLGQRRLAGPGRPDDAD